MLRQQITLPSLPTDNLYKFIFLFGLILCIYTTYLIDSHMDNLMGSNKHWILVLTMKEQVRAKSRVADHVTKLADHATADANSTMEKINAIEKTHKKVSSNYVKELKAHLMALDSNRRRLVTLLQTSVKVS